MLKIFFGDMEDAIYHPPTFFDNQYEDEWILAPLSVEIIKDINKAKVINSHLMESSIWGLLHPTELSGGVKTLILMAFDDSGEIFNASTCGDNCAKWILHIAEEKDLTINLRHLMDFGEEPFDIEILNTGDIVHNMRDLVCIAGYYV